MKTTGLWGSVKFHLYGIGHKAEDSPQPKEEGEPTEEAGHKLDPLRGLGGRGQGIRAIPLWGQIVQCKVIMNI